MHLVLFFSPSNISHLNSYQCQSHKFFFFILCDVGHWPICLQIHSGALAPFASVCFGKAHSWKNHFPGSLQYFLCTYWLYISTLQLIVLPTTGCHFRPRSSISGCVLTWNDLVQYFIHLLMPPLSIFNAVKGESLASFLYCWIPSA